MYYICVIKITYPRKKTNLRRGLSKKMRKYKLIYEDKDANELASKEIEASNIREARVLREVFFAETQIFDCVKITVKRVYES
jgi:hypothetical protein